VLAERQLCHTDSKDKRDTASRVAHCAQERSLESNLRKPNRLVSLNQERNCDAHESRQNQFHQHLNLFLLILVSYIAVKRWELVGFYQLKPLTAQLDSQFIFAYYARSAAISVTAF
jgi:hypothetical protein